MPVKIQKQNIGNAGEYYLASRLSAENFIATITLGRAERYDILAVNPRGKTIKISVKTGYLSTVKGFPLSEKDEVGASSDFFYCFIKLNEFKSEPDFWIIPSERVNKVLKKSEELYRNMPGRRGQKRKGSILRIIPLVSTDFYRRLYPEKWEEELNGYYKNIEQLMK
ncbi:MAG: hypothetical protein NTX00_01805 [Candidatus Parcubacteria bacterium]|nr:hypothetical protein [Candidatus Parcubacteria bacterium]